MLTDDEKSRFIDLLEECCLQDGIGRLRRYSGRSMYGKECVGLVGDHLSEFGVALSLADRAEMFGLQIADLPHPTSDSLGRGIIIYWPRIEWPEGRQEPEGEEEDWD